MRTSDHLNWEILNARKVGHRPGDDPPLGPRDPVPWCECPLCELLRWECRTDAAGGCVDVALRCVLPELARAQPEERMELAERERKAREAAGVELPDTELLVELAGRLPGARRPRNDHVNSLPVEAARNRPILEVAALLQLPVKKTGQSWRGPCPIHGGEGPNFAVDPMRGLFTCFVCNAQGDGIDLYRQVRRTSFALAVRALAG